jgi:sugar lactone lactonase YvrE
VYSLAFAPDGSALASGGAVGAACVWRLPAGELRYRFDGHYPAAVSLAFSPDGRTLATGDGLPYGKGWQEAQVRLWGLGDGRLVRQFTGHLNSVGALAYSPDGRRLASGGGDARARVWDPATGQRLYQIRGAEGQRSVGFSPDGKVLLVGDTGGELALWRADTGEKLRDLGAGGDRRRQVVHATFLRDGKAVVSEEQGNPSRRKPPGLRFWDAASGQETRSVPIRGSYPFYGNSPSGHAISPDGALAATVAYDHRDPAIQLRDTSSGEVLALLRGHSGFVTSLAFSPDGKVLASGSQDTTVLLWDVQQARLVGLWFQLAGSPAAAARAAKRLAANPAGTVPFLQERLRRAAALEAPYTRLIAELDDDRFEVRERASRRLAADAGAEFALKVALQGDPSAELRRQVEGILGRLRAAREERIGRLIADLAGDESFQASRQLQELGEAAEPALRRALQPSPFGGRARAEEDASQRTRGRAREILDRLGEPSNASLPLNAQAVVRALAALEEIGTPEARRVLEELAGGVAEARVTRGAKGALGRLKGRK